MNTKIAGGFAAGFSYPFKAGHFLISHPRLIVYVLIPFLINTIVFTGAVWFGLDFFDETVVAMIPQGDAWYWIILYYFLWIVAVLATVLLVFFSFAIVGNLVASPFNDLLSERTEELITGRTNSEPFRFALFIRESLHIVLDEALKMSAFLAGMLLLLLLNILPGFGAALFTILSLLWTATFLVVEYTGYVFSRKKKKFADQRQFIRKHKALSLGFGFGALCLLAVPFLQFFTIPLSVVGAVHLMDDCSMLAALPEKTE